MFCWKQPQTLLEHRSALAWFFLNKTGPKPSFPLTRAAKRRCVLSVPPAAVVGLCLATVLRSLSVSVACRGGGVAPPGRVALSWTLLSCPALLVALGREGAVELPQPLPRQLASALTFAVGAA